MTYGPVLRHRINTRAVDCSDGAVSLFRRDETDMQNSSRKLSLEDGEISIARVADQDRTESTKVPPSAPSPPSVLRHLKTVETLTMETER